MHFYSRFWFYIIIIIVIIIIIIIIIVAYLHLGTRDSVCIFLQVGFSLANFSLTFRAEGIRIMPLSRVFFAGNGFHVEVVFFSTLL